MLETFFVDDKFEIRMTDFNTENDTNITVTHITISNPFEENSIIIKS